MENLKFILEETDDDLQYIGLIRLVKNIPDYEFFFKLNTLNSFCFQRIDDITLEEKYYTYHYPVFEGYNKESKICFRFLCNKFSEKKQIKPIAELFAEDEDSGFLLKNNSDIDYIITASDKSPDFSVILLPENLTFQLQEFQLGSNDELYQIIQYYE